MAFKQEETLSKPLDGWRLRLYTVIFEADTRAGRLFDQWLIAVILISVLVVVLDSVQTLGAAHHRLFSVLEWIFTVAFSGPLGVRAPSGPVCLEFLRLD